MVDYLIRVVIFIYLTASLIVAFITFWLAMNEIKLLGMRLILKEYASQEDM